MIKKGFLIYFFLMSNALCMWANDIKLTASAPSTVVVGERFRVAFQINARPSEFTAPQFDGFRVLSGPNQSSSTSVQIANGQMTQTTNFTYTFMLEALREGNFTIPLARAIVDRNTYTSAPLAIKVERSTPPPAGQPSPTPDTEQQPDRVDDRDLFVRARASNNNPFQGEQVIITYTLYTRVIVQQYSNEKTPSFQGFWAENITEPGQPQVRTELINGESYHVADILRFALFPQQTGRLTIEPIEIKALVNVATQRRTNIFDDFFGGHPFGTGRQIEQAVRSNQIEVNVKPLPTQNRPDAFNGIVGTNFDVKAELNTTELMVNDAANMSIAISGRGNMRMVEKPQINFPANLEVFDPNITDNITASTSGITGSRSFEYVLIPRTPGEFVIPAFSFVYFDPGQQRFITRTIPEKVLQVSGDAAISGNQHGIASRENILILDNDIRFINTAPLNIIRGGQMFYRSSLFFALIIAPILMFAIFLVYWRNQIKLRSNAQLMKTQKANRVALKRLRVAKKLMVNGSEIEFYDEISKALWGYLSDKLAIPISILNKETVSGAFKAKKVEDELSQRFLRALDDCEFARFAPGEKELRMDEIYQKALDTMVIIEKDLKSKKDKR